MSLFPKIKTPPRINARTDRRRNIILHPIWCPDHGEYLLFEEALKVYRDVFGTNDEVILEMDGIDVSKRRFVMKNSDDEDNKDAIVLESSIGKNDNRFFVRKKVIASKLSSNNYTPLSCGPFIRSYDTSNHSSTLLDLETTLKENTELKKILFLSAGLEIAVINIPVGGKIGEKENTQPEVHPTRAQIFLVQTGSALVKLYMKDEKADQLEQFEVKLIESKVNDTIIIPSNTYHLIENVGSIPFTAVTIYSPVESI